MYQKKLSLGYKAVKQFRSMYCTYKRKSIEVSHLAPCHQAFEKAYPPPVLELQ